jgi:hypothetical protein
MRSRFPLALAAFALVACDGSPTGPDAASPGAPAAPEASVVFQTPEESPGPPFWAISGNGGFIPHDGTWAAIPFVREPGCVPPGQDLLVLAAPAAFGCTLTVEGHEHWQNGPGIDPAPRQTKYRGLGAVPVVFALWSEVQAATDGGLTLSELMGLPSAVTGHADRYVETDIYGVSGPLGPGRGMYKISGAGTLEDGRPFELQVNEVLGELQQVRIAFGS